MNTSQYQSLFLDIGGVLLTNGWDRYSRQDACEKFGIDADEMNERHHLTFDTYEEGKLSLDEYLNRTVFYTNRSFTKDEFRSFMFEQSKPFPDMLKLIKDLKAAYQLRIVAVSNEGRELNHHRIRTFRLYELFDAFISSSFVHFRKPDADIYRMALDVSQVPPEKAIYIDDRKMFVEVAEQAGLKGIHHQKFEKTRDELAALGLSVKKQ